MKITTYKCDSSECKNTTTDIEINNWLEIGSENNTLSIKNYFKNHQLISLQNYKPIHFCSSNCFSRYFFKVIDSEIKEQCKNHLE